MVSSGMRPWSRWAATSPKGALGLAKLACLVGLVLVLVAPLAWALRTTFFVDVRDTKIYAKEVIGDGSSGVVVDYDDEAPKVTLRMDVAGGVSEGDTADITFALANAKFASNVRLSSLGVTAGDTFVRVADKEDGVRGENTVTFRIEASQAIPTATTTVSFAFALPELTGLNPGKDVVATVEVDAAGGGDDPDGNSWWSSDNWRGSDNSNHVGIGANTGLEDGILRALGPTPMAGGARPNKPVVRFADGLEFSVGHQPEHDDTRMIDVGADRTTFVTEGPGTLGTVTVGLKAAAVCEGDSPPSDCILQRNGDPFSISRREDGEGNVVVTVTGDFRTGDVVWLDADGDRTASASEMLTLGDDGAMSGTFELADVAGNSEAARGTLDREEGIAARTLYYRPNGEDALRPSEFRTRASVDFDDTDAADKGAQESRFTTVYAMAADPSGTGAAAAVEAMRTAAAVPALTAADVGNLRIKCEVSSPCVIHLECDDVSGETWFARLDEPIPGRATLHLTASDIAEALGIAAEEGWDDSLSCAILGSRDISVQVLTRSGGVLVNHTYVEND